MTKKILFQLHWFFGITAGLILSIMGISGAIYSYDSQILRALNPDSYVVAAQNQPLLTSSQLYLQAQDYFPNRKINSVTVNASRTEAASVNLAINAAKNSSTDNKRGETINLNPYSGEPLPKIHGQQFFAFVQNLHRYLAMGDFAKTWSDNSSNNPKEWQAYGKQLTGVCVIILIYFVLSGLYLRWPRKSSLKEWLLLKPALTGRSFLWNLHAVAGTWLAVFYLIFALTGLYWSYDWYRDGLFQIMGVERPPQQGDKSSNSSNTPPTRANTAAADNEATLQIPLMLNESWLVFNQQVTQFSAATFKIPERGNLLEITFLDAIPPHDRARNTLKYNVAKDNIEELTLYRDKALNEKIMGSMLPVHRGTFFGSGVFGSLWRAFATLAALSMPLFFITGVMLYLKRRKQKQLTHAAQQGLGILGGQQNPWLIVYASQTGFAEQLAWRTAHSLQQAHIATQVVPIHQLKVEQLQTTQTALFIVSTYGQGEAPDHARGFVKKYLTPNAQIKSVDLTPLNYAVLALGDREYGLTFCGFGKQLTQWLQQSNANPLFDLITVNNGAVDDLKRWNSALETLTQTPLETVVVEKVFDQWQLIERELLNANSQGEPAYALKFVAQHDADWHAGDIAEIQTGNSLQQIAHFLTAHHLDGDQLVEYQKHHMSLTQALCHLNLRDANADQIINVNCSHIDSIQHWLEQLNTLPVREYSIASIAQDGYVQLVVRQKQCSQGLGLGSGWLTAHVEPSDFVPMRIRTNENFHAPTDNRPIILIGNGTGIAGLLSVLKYRELHGFQQNWLIFGERERAHDFFFCHTLQQWQQTGHLQQLDLAFSRDQPQRVYVQHRLAEQQDQLVAWVNQGASIYVCGSIDGMAPAVDEVLNSILGDTTVQTLLDTGRYRRDVY